MYFLHYPLGQVAGAVAVVELSGTDANLMLPNDDVLASYKSGRRYAYCGSYYRQPPTRIGVPSSGRWNIVVELGGAAGNVSASVTLVGG